jgi:hypothetical protein
MGVRPEKNVIGKAIAVYCRSIKYERSKPLIFLLTEQF